MHRKTVLVVAGGLFALVVTGAGTGFAMESPTAPAAAGCPAASLTFSGEAGAPAATSNKFPAGTLLKVTNLDNDRSITVPVAGVSGSCALLNRAAFEQVREPGKNVIRRNRIEVVGAAARPKQRGERQKGAPDARPDAARPDAARPDAARPDAARPDAARPDAARPDADSRRQVCAGSTVTVSGEGGAPAASSSQFPEGTMLRITNLDNNKTVTVPVTGVSGSCALLNSAAFEQVREPGKFLIRRVRIEQVG